MLDIEPIRNRLDSADDCQEGAVQFLRSAWPDLEAVTNELVKLRLLLTELLESTIPFPSALEERLEGRGLDKIWEDLAEMVDFKRSADEDSPTKWDKKDIK